MSKILAAKKTNPSKQTESWVSIFSFLGFPKLATATTQNRPDLQQSFGEFSQKRCAKRRRGGFSLMFCLCFQKFFIKHPKVAMKMATLENLGCLFSPFGISKVGNSNDAHKIVQIQERCAQRRRDVFSLMFCLRFQKFFIKHPKVAMKMVTLENLGCLFSPFWDFQSWQQQRHKIVQIYNKVLVSFHKRGVQKDGVMVFSLMFCLRFQKFSIKHPKVAMKMATLENLGCLFSPFWDFQSWQQQRHKIVQIYNKVLVSFHKRGVQKDGVMVFSFDVLSMFPKFLY